jgi:nitrile hydratase
LIPGPEYLCMSYYEKWHAATIELLVKHGLVTRAEVRSGKRARGSARATPPFSPDKVLPFLVTGRVARRNVPVPPRFQVGQRVRARTINPVGHTRLPRYARGKLGTIERDQGVFVFPDTNAHFLGEKPQHVYLVRFAARELWGEQAKPQDAVYIDLWDDYLEPA